MKRALGSSCRPAGPIQPPAPLPNPSQPPTPHPAIISAIHVFFCLSLPCLHATLGSPPFLSRRRAFSPLFPHLGRPPLPLQSPPTYHHRRRRHPSPGKENTHRCKRVLCTPRCRYTGSWFRRLTAVHRVPQLHVYGDKETIRFGFARLQRRKKSV